MSTGQVLSGETLPKQKDAQINERLGKNLRHLMHVRKVDPPTLSKEIGVALSTVNGLRRGVGNPTLATLNELAKFFKISIGELTEKDISLSENSATSIYEIPLLDSDEIDNFLKNNHKFRKKIATELDSNFEDKNVFCLKIKNDSMTPFFTKNTIFIVAVDEKIEDGDMVLVKFGDNLPCIRQIFIENEAYFFKPISDKLNKNIVNPAHFQIIGIVIKAIQTLTER